MRHTKPTSRLKAVDGLLLLGSALAPLLLFIYYLVRERPQGKRWFRGGFSTPFSTALTLDLIFTSLVFSRFAVQEVRAGRVKGPVWLYPLINTLVGVSPAFPLLLLRRRTEASKAEIVRLPRPKPQH
ncbi:MAG: DUF2834 domain-containing protein [Candidatus Sericytochromatia bacterium]